MSKSLAGVAYSAVHTVQEVGQEGGKIARKSGKLRCRCGFARTQAFKHAWRGIFCRARSPGGRAGSRKNCKQNPANCAVAVLSRAQAFQHGCLDIRRKKPEGDRRTQVIMAPAWMLLIERTTNTDVILAPAWMLLIEGTTNTDVIMAPAWMLLMERPTNTDVIMAPAWMLLIKRTRNMDVIMVPAWMLLIERPTNTDVIMAPAWMLLIERTTNTDVFMPSASASAMRAERFTPCVVAAAFLSPRQVPKCCSCHAGQSRRAWERTHVLRVYGPSEPQTNI